MIRAIARCFFPNHNAGSFDITINHEITIQKHHGYQHITMLPLDTSYNHNIDWLLQDNYGITNHHITSLHGYLTIVTISPSHYIII